MGYRDEARNLYSLAEELADEEVSVGHPVLSAIYANWAMLERDAANPAEARRLLDLALTPNPAGNDPRDRAVWCSHAALLASDQGDLAAARRWLGEAIALGERGFGPDPPHVAVFRLNLAGVELREGRHEPALDLARAAYRVLRDKLRPDHP